MGRWAVPRGRKRGVRYGEGGHIERGDPAAVTGPKPVGVGGAWWAWDRGGLGH
jgi:hypothetical protein